MIAGEASTTLNCRLCGSANLWPFLDLGNQPIPRFPKTVTEQVPHAPLVLVKCESCQLVQLAESVPRDLLFREFWYRSGISSSIKNDLNTIAVEGIGQIGFNIDGIALDIGCNDGTLLRCLPGIMRKVGFEPATNLAVLAQDAGEIAIEYFNAKTCLTLFGKAKLVFSIAMFYDLEDPTGFCREVAECLEDDGVWIVQQNYLGLMLQNTAYDNICHEHLTYFSLRTLEDVLAKAGLEVYHVELNQINGGSMKTFIAKKGKRAVDDSVQTLELSEVAQDLAGRKAYRDFSYRVRENARAINRFLVSAVEGEEKKVMIYGAGTRGATLFQFASGFNKPHIVAAVDNNPEKHGRYYLDTGIPIVSREQALKHPPDYFLVLPYHVAGEIVSREKESFPKANWIIPLPEFKVA